MAEGDFSVKAIISAETSKFEKSMKTAQNSLQNVSKSIEGVSKLLKSAFSVVGIGVSVKAIADFGKKATATADEANKRFKILSNTIKATGAATWTSTEELDKMAKAYAQTTNYSVSEVEKMQSVLLGFRNITNETFGEASDAIMDMATVMGMDLTSAVQTVGKALDDPISGLDSLRRQGFAFTEEQKQELKVLVRNGEQLKAQKIILDELATTYGGAAKAGQSAFARLQHTMDDFYEVLGNKLMPLVNNMSVNLSKSVSKITEVLGSAEFDKFVAIMVNLGNKVKVVFEGIKNYISNVFTEIKGLVTSVNFSPFESVLDTLLGVILKIAGELKKAKEDVENAFDELKTRFSGFTQTVDFENIAEKINTVIDVIIFLRDEILKVANQIIKIVNDLVNKVWNKIVELFTESTEALSKSESNIKSWSDYFYTIFDNLFKIVQDLIYSVSALLEGDWVVAWEYAKLIVLRVVSFLVESMETMKNAFQDKIHEILTISSTIAGSLPFGKEISVALKTLDKLTTKTTNVSKDIEKLIKETETKITQLTGKAADISLKDLKGISSSSKGLLNDLKRQLRELGLIVEETGKDISETTEQTIETTESKSSKFFKALEGAWSNLKESIEEDANDWTDVLTSSYQAITGASNQMFEMLSENLVGAGNSYEDFGAVALEALAQVLEALAAQLTAIAALRAANYDFASAAVAAAGAAAALVAAGAIKGVAKQMKSTADSAKSTAEYVQEVKNTLSDIGKETVDFASFVSGYNQKLTLLNTSLEKYEKKQQENAANLPGWRNQYNSLTNSINSLKNEYKSLEEAYEKVRFIHIKDDDWDEIERDRLTSKMRKNRERRKELENQRNAISGSISQAESQLRDLQNSYNTALKSFEDYAKESVNAFKETTQSMLDYINTFDTLATMAFDSADIASVISETIRQNLMSIPYQLRTTLTEIGTDIGSTMVSGIIEGSTKQDFLKSLKSYLKEQLVQLYVYTEDFADALSKTGQSFVSAMISGDQNELRKARTQIESIYTYAETRANQAEQFLSTVFGDIKEDMDDLITSAAEVGDDIADQLINNLTSGLKEEDFMSTMKEYIRKLVINSVVYTQSLKSKIEEIGKTISDGLKTGFTESSLSAIKNELSDTFKDVTKSVSQIDDIFDKVFGKNGSIEDDLDNLNENLTKFEQMINELKNTISDLGGDVANELVNALTNGLGQSNFLETMKSYIKKMLVQTMVYTESMKAEIEAIGKAISQGLTSGFTETSIHEIRRDLSYLFDQTNKTVSQIDSVLDKVFNVTGYASGTNNATSGIHLVGEAGPELVRFRGGEQVYNAGQTQEMLSGNTVINQNVTFNNLQDTSAYVMMQQFKQYNREMAINGIL